MLKSLLVGLVLIAAVSAAGIAYWSNGDMGCDSSCCQEPTQVPACCSPASDTAPPCCQEGETSSAAAPDCCAVPKAKCCEEKASASDLTAKAKE